MKYSSDLNNCKLFYTYRASPLLFITNICIYYLIKCYLVVKMNFVIYLKNQNILKLKNVSNSSTLNNISLKDEECYYFNAKQ